MEDKLVALQKTLDCLGKKGITEWDINLLRSYMTDDNGNDLRLSKHGYWRPSEGKSQDMVEKEKKLLGLGLVEPWGDVSEYGKEILRSSMKLDYQTIFSLPNHDGYLYQSVQDVCFKRSGSRVSLFFYGEFYRVEEKDDMIFFDLTKMYESDAPILSDGDKEKIGQLLGANLLKCAQVSIPGYSYDEYGGRYGYTLQYQLDSTRTHALN